MKLSSIIKWRRRCILLAPFFAISALGHAQNKTAEQLDSLFSSLHKQNAFNGNVLIAENGKPIYEASFGLENFEKNINLSSNSIFELASCSKQFTAFAIALLQQQGKLNVQDYITKWLPALQYYQGITIQNLVHHTSGLPDYMELFDSLWDKTKIATNDDIITLFAANKPKILFEPGEKFEYSNTGYALLASIIEKASGKSYGDFLKQNIFTPLKMNHTFVYNRRYKPQSVNHYAFDYLYESDKSKYVSVDSITKLNIEYFLDGISGDGTVNATAQDLLKWDQALYTDKLLPAIMRKEIFATTTTSSGETNPYAYGWMIANDAELGTIAAHSGGWGGYRSYIERHLDKNKTVIILQNTDRATIPIAEVRPLMYGKPLPKPKSRSKIEVDESTLSQYVGEYELAPGYVMTISMREKQLYTQLTGQQPFAIFPETARKFFLTVVEAQLEFVVDDKGKVSKAILYQNGNKVDAIKK